MRLDLGFLVGAAAALWIGTAEAGSFATFDVPGSADTQPTAINAHGAVTGSYINADGSVHGFLRAPDGTITPFDIPGISSTIPRAINADGAILGNSVDFVGFVRKPDGTSATFHPGGSGQVLPAGINAAGTAAGYYTDGAGMHGFLRDLDGTLTTVEVGTPGNTALYAINDAGVVSGSNLDNGFLRYPDGSVTLLDASNVPVALNARAWSAGNFIRRKSIHAFLRRPSGETVYFGQGFRDLTVSAVDKHGTVSGTASRGNLLHGFTYTKAGVLGVLDAPGAGTGYHQGTYIVAGNARGVLAGFTVDGHFHTTGFVWTP